jgi:hypothetical protein
VKMLRDFLTFISLRPGNLYIHTENFIFMNNECVICNSKTDECLFTMPSKYKDVGQICRNETSHEVKRWIITETSLLSVRNWRRIRVCKMFFINIIIMMVASFLSYFSSFLTLFLSKAK